MNLFRQQTIDSIKNEDVKRLMNNFFEAHDNLFNEMDNLSYDEYKIKNHEMWEFRNKSCNYGEYFLISTFGLEKKAKKLYGKKTNFYF